MAATAGRPAKICQTACSACDDTGWIPGPRGAHRCECAIRAAAEWRFERIGLPPHLSESDFERFDAGAIRWSRDRYNARIAALRRTQAFAADFPAGAKRGLLLHGEDRAGMAFLAAAAVRALAGRGLHCAWVECRELYRAATGRWSTHPITRRPAAAFQTRLDRTDLIAIPDLGAERRTPQRVDTAEGLLRSRYMSMKGLVVVSSLPLETTEAGETTPRNVFPDTLPDRIGPHATWWLLEHCAQVRLPLPSRPAAPQA